MTSLKHTALIAVTCLFLSACAESGLEIASPESPAQNTNRVASKTKSGTSDASLSIPSDEGLTYKVIDEDEETETLVATAEKMRQRGDLASANVMFQRAASTNPKSMKALIGVARIAEETGKPREAIAAYRSMIQLDDEFTPAYLGLGRNFMVLGLYDKAVQELDKLRAREGDKPESLNLLAMSHLRNDAEAKAVELLQLAVEKYPEHLTSQNNLGFAYVMSGKLDEAIAVLEKLVENKNANAQHRQNLALAYGLAGRDSDARKISLQDLPPAAVENNLKTYRTMRAKKLGVADLAPKKVPPAKKATRKAAPKPAAEKVKSPEKTVETPAPPAEPAPQPAPATPVEMAPAPIPAAPPAAGPAPEPAPAPAN